MIIASDSSIFVPVTSLSAIDHDLRELSYAKYLNNFDFDDFLALFGMAIGCWGGFAHLEFRYWITNSFNEKAVLDIVRTFAKYTESSCKIWFEDTDDNYWGYVIVNQKVYQMTGEVKWSADYSKEV